MPKIRITCTEQVTYDQVHEVSQEQYNTYLAAVDRDEDDDWFARWADSYIDRTDVCGADDLEDVEASIVAPVTA